MLARSLLALLLIPSALAQLPDGVSPEWTDALDLTVENQGWERADLSAPYDRLPASAEGVVRGAVWGLSRNSAGLAVRFVSDSPQIFARWTLLNADFTMDHMPNTGINGVDLYARDGDVWKWVGVGRIRQRPTNASRLVEDAPEGEHEYLLYLPLYNGVTSLEIGVSPEYHVTAAEPRQERPIVFYGTSITQGGCASRGGMAYPAIIGRALDRPAVNLGFSGNGWMDLEFAPILAQIDAAVFVLDNGPNMDTEGVQERMVPFITALREARPDTPIVLMENIVFTDAWFEEETRTLIEEKNAAIRAAYETLVANGVEGITYVPAEGLIGDDEEGAVDGVHLTDLGFERMADALVPVIEPLLD